MFFYIYIYIYIILTGALIMGLIGYISLVLTPDPNPYNTVGLPQGFDPNVNCNPDTI